MFEARAPVFFPQTADAGHGSRSRSPEEPPGSGRRTLAALLLLLALAALYSTEVAARAPDRTTGVTRGDASQFYDREVHQRGMDSLRKGDVEGAVSTFCTMFAIPRDVEVWTLSVVLVCDAGGVWDLARQVTDLTPVFVQLREFQGKRCYRVCAGLATSRAEASRWLSRVPEALKAQGPFPVRVALPCAPSAVTGSPSGVSTSTPRAGERPQPPMASPAESSPPKPSGAQPSSPGSRESQMWFVPPKPLPPSSPDAAREAQSWFEKGLAAYREGHRMDAYEYYNNALALDPERPEILNNLGVLYLEDHQYAQAQTLFVKAVDRSPTYARARLNLAGALWGLKDWDGAIEQARRACELDARDVNARLTLASFFLAQERRQEAAAAAREALAIDPQNAQAKVFLETSQSPLKEPKVAR